MSDLLCHTLRTHAVVLQEQLDTTYKPGINRGTTVEAKISIGDTVAATINILYGLCVCKDASFLLRVVEQVEAERVGWG